jgi:beta-phosphoglucomutase-like phosphatase (HAD superfamily)
MDTVTLYTCTHFEALEIQALLEAENIPVALVTSSESVTTTVVGGSPLVDVRVRAEDLARARQALGL